MNPRDEPGAISGAEYLRLARTIQQQGETQIPAFNRSRGLDRARRVVADALRDGGHGWHNGALVVHFREGGAVDHGRGPIESGPVDYRESSPLELYAAADQCRDPMSSADVVFMNVHCMPHRQRGYLRSTLTPAMQETQDHGAYPTIEAHLAGRTPLYRAMDRGSIADFGPWSSVTGA
jgi:hypothetical protein